MLYLIGRYHEIALKGRNQWRFIDQLKINLHAAFADFKLGRVRSEGPRLLVELPEEIDERTAAERAALLLGLQNFTLSRAVPLKIEDITREALAVAIKHRSAGNFRVRARRSDKRFALNSMEIEQTVGAAIKEAAGLKVSLENPELVITVEILPDAAYVAAGKHPGAGGLPVGIAGHGVALLSGGIDSPVAAYRMMRRGLRLDYVHFHSHPLVSSASREKAAELAEYLTRYQSRSSLILVAFADLQREVVARGPRPLRVVLYRRFMLRIASAIARRVGARVLVTGESLGQVASQTLENMTVIEAAAAFPVLRPLVGMDKNEIVEQARALGTFETSIQPDQDCCSLFVPPHPETHASLEEVCEAERVFDIEAMVAEAVRRAEDVRLTFPGRPPRRDLRE
jgi:thiamine biosynthesis protein ThiI